MPIVIYDNMSFKKTMIKNIGTVYRDLQNKMEFGKAILLIYKQKS